MTTTKHHNYDEDKIKSLSSLEHIRKRTGMYIGRVGDGSDYDDGIYILLKEIVDNAVDEFIMGYGDRIAITLDGPRVTVRDYGRGIPLGKVVECVSRINTGAKVQRRGLPVQRRPERHRHQGGQRPLAQVSRCAASATASSPEPSSSAASSSKNPKGKFRTNRTARSSASNRTRKFSAQ